MDPEVKRAKAMRTNKLSAFTRKRNHLQSLIDGGARGDKLKDAYKDLAEAYTTLEKAHEEFILLVDDDIIAEEASYLDAPAVTLSDMDLRVTQAAENQEKVRQDTEKEQQAQQQRDREAENVKRKQNRAKAVLKASIEGFGKPSRNLSELSSAKTISFSDMRAEIEKIETSLAKILQEKVNLLDLDPSADLGAENDMLNSLVVDEVDRCKGIALEYLKDVPEPVVTPVATAVDSSVRGTGFSQTKRETVMLPKFSGDEKTAFLKYPVWKTQWFNHITEYEVKYRATMLLNHLDDKATLQIIGHENDYDKSMELLDRS